jgi:hypothetical protein
MMINAITALCECDQNYCRECEIRFLGEFKAMTNTSKFNHKGQVMRAPLGYDRSYTNAQMGTAMNSPTPLTLAEFNAIGKPNPDYVDGAYVGDMAQGAPAEIPEWVEQGNRDWRNAVQVAALHDDIAGFVETETDIAGEGVYEGMRNRLAVHGSGYRPSIKVIADHRNNVHRRCSYRKNEGRIWQILVPMQDQEYTSYYLIQNMDTGERCIVWDRLLHNLY